MFIVKKNIKGKDYYYAQESRRENGKVVSKSVAYLGVDKKEAEKKLVGLKAEAIKGAHPTRAQVQKSGEKLPGPKRSPTLVESSDKMRKRGGESEKKDIKEINIEELTNFCKRKGFVFRSSDIYGGYSGFWDFGPLGVELFNNIRKDWWEHFVLEKENMVGIEASVISHPRTWKASGHLESFADVAVVCKKCKKSTKLDKSEVGKVKCECGGDYESQEEFNLMFKTKVGALDACDSYLRGETAQAMFMDFKMVHESSRMQLPFGIAQIGRCFRNEIAPRDFLFRLREFHIGEFEFFIHPDEKKCDLLDKKHLNVKVRLLDAETQDKKKDDLRDVTIGEMLSKKKLGEWHAYWLAEQVMWFNDLGLAKIKIREHMKDELSHYSSATFDIDYEYPFGSQEVAGNANRGQYDLTQHEKESGKSMSIFDEKSKQKVIPRVIEPTFGMERVFLAILTNAYTYDSKRENIVLKIPARLAPIKVAVLPLVKNDKKLVKMARSVFEDLKKSFHVSYDASGSVGRRYSRNDEIGTPYCITVDSDSLKDESVTVRDRDSTEQVRVGVGELREVIGNLFGGGKFGGVGERVETRKK